MTKIKILITISIIILQFPIIAQSTGTSNSKKDSAEHGLMFDKEMEKRLDDNAYINVIQLLRLSDKAQALQFRILLNKAPGDSTLVIFNDIKKGADLKDPSWLLDYNVIKGSTEKNGASKDEIFVLLYNVNSGEGLQPGDYDSLFTVHYEVADITALKYDLQTSIKISNAEASTSKGEAIDIKPTRDELKLLLKKE